jgi:hypothetical protein
MSYAAIADADAWHGARGSESWPAPPEEEGEDDPNAQAKAAALVRATDYLNGLSWHGARAQAGRVMAWPRIGATDRDGYELPENAVPEAVKAACCLLAGIAYTGTDLQPVLERGGRVASESVGSLSTSYFDDAACRDVYSGLADLLIGLCGDFDGYSGPAITGRGKVTMAAGVLG